jgi:hypothetical protein
VPMGYTNKRGAPYSASCVKSMVEGPTRSLRLSNVRFREASGSAPIYPSARQGWIATAKALDQRSPQWGPHHSPPGVVEPIDDVETGPLRERLNGHALALLTILVRPNVRGRRSSTVSNNLSALFPSCRADPEKAAGATRGTHNVEAPLGITKKDAPARHGG